HISRPVTVELLREADRVYAMTASQRDALDQMDPACAPRIRLLAEDCVPDPIGGDLAAYRGCAAAISAAVEKILSEI
ncbi:MAG: hypothetical protein JXA90_02565, partial [Planctomycetes bacterium]|nr:hypothetical protein [Planctomycetota bacterium]